MGLLSLVLTLLFLLRFQVSIDDCIGGLGQVLLQLAVVVVRQQARMPAVVLAHGAIMDNPALLSNARALRPGYLSSVFGVKYRATELRQ